MFSKKLLSICCTFLLNSCFSQIDSAFFTHLSKQQLKREQKTYLNRFDQQSDTTTYYLAKHYFQFNENEKFLAINFENNPFLQKDTSLIVNFSVEYLNSLKHNTSYWFDRSFIVDMQSSSRLNELKSIYQLSKNPTIAKGINLPNQLETDFQFYRQSYKKKGWISGSLSTVVPGLGMLYLKKPRAFLSQFIMVTGLAFQTIESYQKFGIKHPLTIITGTLFTGFYSVNVIGSILAVKKNRLERKKQFLKHASDYYAITYATNFY